MSKLDLLKMIGYKVFECDGNSEFTHIISEDDNKTIICFLNNNTDKDVKVVRLNNDMFELRSYYDIGITYFLGDNYNLYAILGDALFDMYNTDPNDVKRILNDGVNITTYSKFIKTLNIINSSSDINFNTCLLDDFGFKNIVIYKKTAYKIDCFRLNIPENQLNIRQVIAFSNEDIIYLNMRGNIKSYRLTEETRPLMEFYLSEITKSYNEFKNDKYEDTQVLIIGPSYFYNKIDDTITIITFNNKQKQYDNIIYYKTNNIVFIIETLLYPGGRIERYISHGYNTKTKDICTIESFNDKFVKVTWITSGKQDYIVLKNLIDYNLKPSINVYNIEENKVKIKSFKDIFRDKKTNITEDFFKR